MKNLVLIPIVILFACFFYYSNSDNLKVDSNNNSNSKKPNIVLIYVDDQGTLDLGCYGARDIKTPAIDNLAKEGVRFTSAYAHTVCCPSRASLLTGRAPQRSGVNNWTSCHIKDTLGRVMNLKEITIAEHLKNQGYQTGIIGKWHLGALLDHGPLEQGFDTFFGFRGGFIDYYSHSFLHAKWQRPQFHDLYSGKKEIFKDGQYFPDLQVKEAQKFITQNTNKPFFLYLPFNLPHYPEQADSTIANKYKHLKWPRNSYAPMIATMDKKIGEVLNTLEITGIKDNTIIIYMSDNGHSTEDYYNWDVSYGGNGGGGYTGKWRGAKGSFLEGGLRVPAIISYPKKFPKNEVRNETISNLDILPTICDILDIPKPPNKLDGYSALPIILSDKATSKHEVMHWMWQHMWAVRKGKWKLIYKGYDTTGKYSNHPEKPFEMPEYYLANLDEDTPEETNHASKYPEIVLELKTLHDDWAIDVFKNSGDIDPNQMSIENKYNKSKPKGTKKL
ncbi:sulfatase-like hydrolase/transferase [uncultured Algibacter sp.]|uniref:sulfatase-like hydrolase/transferase n=1 Tax=uncultured Algibacter sp. TaxID=298659 RepID=UPI00261979BA|nr:sulfatase-like hydrolase/transferase [uncultured Algibacter sp.]